MGRLTRRGTGGSECRCCEGLSEIFRVLWGKGRVREGPRVYAYRVGSRIRAAGCPKAGRCSEILLFWKGRQGLQLEWGRVPASLALCGILSPGVVARAGRCLSGGKVGVSHPGCSAPCAAGCPAGPPASLPPSALTRDVLSGPGAGER